MTREQIIKHWDMIKSFKEGQVIQFKDGYGDWIDIDEPLFKIDSKYRVKPKQEYIPFDYSDGEYLIGKSIKEKKTNDYELIISVSSSYSGKDDITISEEYLSFLELFENYTFIDGSPCGKLKQ